MYCVIVGDIIQSRSMEPQAREDATACLIRVLDQINFKYRPGILAPFGIVRGDAFEGVLYTQADAPRIIQDILRGLYEKDRVRVRISTAMGPLSLARTERDLADGEAFHTALARIEGLRRDRSGHWFQVSMYTGSPAQPLVDGLLRLLGTLTRSWTDKQTRAVWAMLDYGNQQSAARALGVHPNVISKQLRAADFEGYQTAWENLEQYLTDSGQTERGADDHDH